MATETASKAPPPKETFHFINDPADAINEACHGLTVLKPDLSYNADYKVLYRSDLPTFSESHVTTIGFAGGGHEPMFGGFVGHNYLSAYVSGNIFASPTAAQIFEAIKMCQPATGKSKGTLVVCGNYTGDILNASSANRARTSSEVDPSELRRSTTSLSLVGCEDLEKGMKARSLSEMSRRRSNIWDTKASGEGIGEIC